MTAVTGSPTTAQSGRLLSGGVRDAAQIHESAHGFGTAGRPLSTASAATPATVAESGRTAVPSPRPETGLRNGIAQLPTTSAATAGHLSPQVAAAPTDARRDSSDQGEPVSATVAEDGPECAAVAYVEALDGAERKILLTHIAQAFPDVVEAGVELVARWRAEAAERRRVASRKHEHERRRRRAAEAGNR